jgi:serine/threonine protein kinase
MFTYGSDNDDEEPDFESQPNTVEIISPTESIQNVLDNALKNYQRNGYLDKFLISEMNDIPSGSFGVVFKAKFKQIGSLCEESETFAIKKIKLDIKKLRGAIREYEFYSKIELKKTSFAHAREMWFEKEFGVDLYSLYLRMEWCAENLRKGMQLLRKSYNPPGNRVANKDLALFNMFIFEELLNAFVTLQSYPSPIIHRDFKPDNVLFSKHGIKLCDFGCATPHVQQFSHVKSSENVDRDPLHTRGVGSPLYQAPEQKRSESTALETGKYDWKVDMWALGLTLLEMFYETSVPDLDELFNDVHEKHEIPANLQHKWPKIAAIILNLTENDSQKRKSAKDTLIDLNQLWTEVIGNDTKHTDLEKKIEGSSIEFQAIVDEWVVS